MNPTQLCTPLGVELMAPVVPELAPILSPEALEFVAYLERYSRATRQRLMRQREQRQTRFDRGERPDFLAETAEIRAGQWRIAEIPPELADRRVEITGPVDRKTIINALNSGAQVYMADFEDAHSPTWEGTVEGQFNLRDAVAGVIEHTSPEGKKYQLGKNPATLMVRPRGLHLDEKHLYVDARAVSASIFDFGLFMFHNAHTLKAKGSAPYFYLPKLESHLEARWWNDVFRRAQVALELPQGTIKATVLIETITAAFEMDEILYELRDHAAGLNCGRWDYIFSFIKKFRNQPDYVLPERARVTMDAPFLASYAQLLVETCHRRGAHAMGGMAAQVPIKDDPQANDQALSRVRADKLREVGQGFDGTWVAHPGLVSIARDIFDAGTAGSPNQLDRRHEHLRVTAEELLRIPSGLITLEGLRTNVAVGVRYLEAWLRGTGCVSIFNLMEDAATAEISRAQIWQWIEHPRGRLDDGKKITTSLVESVTADQLTQLREQLGEEAYAQSKFEEAEELFLEVATSSDFVEFFTLTAYELLE